MSDFQELTQDHNQEQKQEQPTPELIQPDKVYQDNIYALVDEFIDLEYAGLTDQELKQDRGFFPRLIKYINNNYLQGLLHTKVRKGYKEPYYDIVQLNYIFNIYTDLVFKYKFNNRASLLEFSILTGISRDTINTWLNGHVNRTQTTPDNVRIVKSWLQVCEQSVVDGSGEYVKEIFLLKSLYNYKESDNTLIVKHEMLPTINADILPEMIDPKKLVNNV